MKIKINSGHLLLVLIAIVFAFGPVWFSYQKKAVYQAVSRDWISIRLPGKISELSIPGTTKFKFIAANDSYRSAVVSLIPTPKNGKLRIAFDKGGGDVAMFINHVILNQSLANIMFKNTDNPYSYKLSAIRKNDKWYMAGKVWLTDDKSNAILVLVYSQSKKNSMKVLDKILGSVKLKK